MLEVRAPLRYSRASGYQFDGQRFSDFCNANCWLVLLRLLLKALAFLFECSNKSRPLPVAHLHLLRPAWQPATWQCPHMWRSKSNEPSPQSLLLRDKRLRSPASRRETMSSCSVNLGDFTHFPLRKEMRFSSDAETLVQARNLCDLY